MGPEAWKHSIRESHRGFLQPVCQRESSAFVNATQAADANVAASATCAVLESLAGGPEPISQPIRAARHVQLGVMCACPGTGVLTLTNHVMYAPPSSVLSQTPALRPRAGWDTEPVHIRVRFIFLWKSDIIT